MEPLIGIRTYDPLITNEMLCQLSYSGEYSVIICGDGCFVNTFWRNNLNFCEGLSARVARGQKKKWPKPFLLLMEIILFGVDGKDPRWEADAVFYLGEGDEDDGSCRRKGVEVGHEFDLQPIRF